MINTATVGTEGVQIRRDQAGSPQTFVPRLQTAGRRMRFYIFFLRWYTKQNLRLISRICPAEVNAPRSGCVLGTRRRRQLIECIQSKQYHWCESVINSNSSQRAIWNMFGFVVSITMTTSCFHPERCGVFVLSFDWLFSHMTKLAATTCWKWLFWHN